MWLLVSKKICCIFRVKYHSLWTTVSSLEIFLVINNESFMHVISTELNAYKVLFKKYRLLIRNPVNETTSWRESVVNQIIFLKSLFVKAYVLRLSQFASPSVVTVNTKASDSVFYLRLISFSFSFWEISSENLQTSNWLTFFMSTLVSLLILDTH